MAAAGVKGALANVEINLDGITDAGYVTSMREKVAALRQRVGEASRTSSARDGRSPQVKRRRLHDRNKTSLGNRGPLGLRAAKIAAACALNGNVFVFAEAGARGTPGS